jgi:hypothetical protein
LNRTLLRRHCRAQQTPNRTAKTHTESVLKNHFGGSQNRRLHRNTKITSYHRLTRVATGHPLLHQPLPSSTPKTSVTYWQLSEFIYRIATTLILGYCNFVPMQNGARPQEGSMCLQLIQDFFFCDLPRRKTRPRALTG